MVGNIVGQYGLGVQIKAEDKASRVIKQVRGNFDRFRRSAMANSARVRGHIESIGDDFRRMRSQMMLGAQFVGAGAAMAAPLFLVSRAAAKSEENLAKVKSLLVTTMDPAQVEENMQKIQTAIFTTGRGSIRPIHELELAMYDLLSANLGVTEAMGALKPTADLAVAGLGTMDQAVKLQTTILNTYGKRWGDTLTSIEKAFKSSNILAGTIAKYKTTLPELSQAMSYSIGMANTLGVEFAELSASIAAAQTAGLQGTLAGTALNAFYRSATKLVKENGEVIDDSNMSLEERFRLIDEGAATMKAKASSLAGIQLADEAGNLLPLPDILNEIEKRFNITAEAAREVAKKGMNGSAALSRMGVSAEKAGELQALFSDEGSRMIAVLLGQGDALRENIRLINDSNNLDKMTAARQDTLIGKLQILKNKIQEEAVTLGELFLPEIKEATESFGGFVGSLLTFTKEHPELIRAFGRTTLALGGLTVALGAAKIATAGFMFAWKPIYKIIKAVGTLRLGIFGLIATLASIGLDKLTETSAANQRQSVESYLDRIEAEEGIIGRLKVEREIGFLGDSQALRYLQYNRRDRYGFAALPTDRPIPVPFSDNIAGQASVARRSISPTPIISPGLSNEERARWLESNRQDRSGYTDNSQNNFNMTIVNESDVPMTKEFADKFMREVEKTRREMNLTSPEGRF